VLLVSKATDTQLQAIHVIPPPTPASGRKTLVSIKLILIGSDN
jgi:hypothetical protein